MLIVNNIRFTYYENRIIRIEKKHNDQFEDRNSYFIGSRNELKESEFIISEDKKNYYLRFLDYELEVSKKIDSVFGIKVKYVGNVKRTTFITKNLQNSGVLPDLDKTPEVFELADRPRFIPLKNGYVVNNETLDIWEDSEDIYLFFPRMKMPNELRKQFVELCGRPELVRLSHLGLWNSRYYKHSEESAKKMMLDYLEHDIPLDNMVIDTDWRITSEIGTGYVINESLFPDMKSFFDYAHSKNIEIMFNDHPQPVDGAKSLFDNKEIEFRNSNLSRILDMGLDTWWYDRNWFVKLVPPSSYLTSESLGMYLFHDVTKKHYEKEVSDKKYTRRPIIMANVDDIENGYINYIRDSASHRYSIQWTGDTDVDLTSLCREVNNIVYGGKNCIPYVHPDTGGHIKDPSDEDYIRWMEFCAFAPIYRPHATCSCVKFREPWNYSDRALNIAREYIKMRYRLIPDFYKAAFEAYKTGKPICEPLGLYDPFDKKALKVNDEFIINNKILVKPIKKESPLPLKDEFYVSKVNAKFYQGTKLEGDVIYEEELDRIHFARFFEPYNNVVPAYNFSTRYECDIRIDETSEFYVNSDDGVRVFVNNQLMLDDWTPHGTISQKVCVLEKDKTYHLVIEYFQEGGTATLSLNYLPIKEQSDEEKVYLPKGHWIDVYTGKMHRGGRYISRQYELDELPIFVSCSSLIPLLDNANNTKEQDWSKMTFDIYPGFFNSSNYLYEDDHETVAYKYDEYRICRYSLKYERYGIMYIIIEPCEGIFKDKIKYRNVLFKIHQNKDYKKINRILVNDNDIKFVHHKKRKEVSLFNTGVYAKEAHTYTFKLKIDLNKRYVIKVEYDR